MEENTEVKEKLSIDEGQVKNALKNRIPDLGNFAFGKIVHNPVSKCVMVPIP